MNVHSVSLKGRRPQNEDKHDIVLNINGNRKNLQPINLFAVYDGHGGKEVSEFIFSNLSKYFVDKRVSYPLSRKYVTDVFDHMQKILKSKDFAYHCGSTALVIANFKHNGENYLNVVNLGDCRCILARDNFAMPLKDIELNNWGVK
jgi:serine/threonine protein phosphatase PrpC